MANLVKLDVPRFIVISGIIGAGKSTLSDAVAARIPGCLTLQEPVAENPYLGDFYKDMARYAFTMQAFLLEARYRQHCLAVANLLAGRTVVQDRSIYEDKVFAKMLHDAGLMDDRDYMTYLRFFESYSVQLQRPDLLIYLDVSPEVALARTLRRKRDAERVGIDLPYLQKLQTAYEEWFERMTDKDDPYLKIVRLQGNEFLDAGDVLDVIVEHGASIHRFHEDWGRKHV